MCVTPTFVSVLTTLPPQYVAKILDKSNVIEYASKECLEFLQNSKDPYIKQFCSFLKNMYDNSELTELAYSRLFQSSIKLSYFSLYGVIQQQKKFCLICQTITEMTISSHFTSYPSQETGIFFLKYICMNPDIIPLINPDTLGYSSVDSEGYLMIYLCEMSADKKEGWEVSSRAKGLAFIYNSFVMIESDGLNRHVQYEFSEDMTLFGKINGGIFVANSIIIGSLKLYGEINFGFLVRFSLNKLKKIFEKIKESRFKFAVPEKLIRAFLGSLHKTIRNIDPDKLTVQRIQYRGFEYIYFGEVEIIQKGRDTFQHKSGCGAMLFPEGLISVGKWEKNAQKGRCRYLYQDGTTRSGTLNNF